MSGRLLGTFGGVAALDKEPAINWLIPGWLPARELSVVYGHPGTYKSFIAQGWSLELAARRRCRTMYVAAEGISGLRARVDAWRAAHLGRPNAPIPTWHYYDANVWVDVAESRQLWVDELMDYMDAAVGGGLDLLVVDTLARNFQGDENSAREMGLFVDGIERIRRELGTAIVVVHHMGIATGRERGTLALRAASFAMFKTGNPRERGDGGASVDLTCDRMKDAEVPDKRRVELDRVDLDTHETGDVYRYSLSMRPFIRRHQGSNRRRAG